MSDLVMSMFGCVVFFFIFIGFDRCSNAGKTNTRWKARRVNLVDKYTGPHSFPFFELFVLQSNDDCLPKSLSANFMPWESCKLVTPVVCTEICGVTIFWHVQSLLIPSFPLFFSFQPRADFFLFSESKLIPTERLIPINHAKIMKCISNRGWSKSIQKVIVWFNKDIQTKVIQLIPKDSD